MHWCFLCLCWRNIKGNDVVSSIWTQTVLFCPSSLDTPVKTSCSHTERLTHKMLEVIVWVYVCWSSAVVRLLLTEATVTKLLHLQYLHCLQCFCLHVRVCTGVCARAVRNFNSVQMCGGKKGMQKGWRHEGMLLNNDTVEWDIQNPFFHVMVRLL